MRIKTKVNRVLGSVFGGLFLICLGAAAASGVADFFECNLGNLFGALFLAFVFLVLPVLLYVLIQKG